MKLITIFPPGRAQARPHREMIVYGRRNYYKRKYVQRRSICAACGTDTFLSSYNATRCFHVARLPLFPVAQNRVFDHCPICNAATEESLRTWRRLKRDDLAPALNHLCKFPADPAAARYALALVTRLDDENAFDEVAERILTHHFENSLLLAELGAAFHHFGRTRDGNDALLRSLALHEDPRLRSHLAYYQSVPPQPPASPPPPLLPQLLPLTALPLILLAGLLLLGKAAFLGAPRQVFLLNGINRPYDVLVNGEQTRLEAMAWVPIKSGPRTFCIEPVPGGEDIDPFVQTFRAPLFNRGAGKRVTLLNPDRSAILLWERATYGDPAAAVTLPADAPSRFHAGNNVYVFQDIDAALTSLPQALKKNPSPDVTHLDGLRQLTRFDPAANATIILGNGQHDTLIEYTRHGLRYHPDNESFLTLLAAYWDPPRALACLEERLSERPILVEWHRYYQELTVRYHPETDLLTTYRRLHAAEPENREIAFLLGRLIDNPSESISILERAARPPGASAYALHALAYLHMSRSDYERALELEEAALELLPDKPRFRALEEEMLLATGRFSDLIKRRRAAFSADESNQSAAVSLASLLALAGETSEARAVAARHLERTIGSGSSPDAKKRHAEISALFDAVLAQCDHDLAAFARASDRISFGQWPYYAAIAKRDLVRAIALLQEDAGQSWREHLLLYSVAAAEGIDTIALEEIEKAARLLRQGGPRERPIAEWFTPEAAAPNLEEVYGLKQWPQDTRIILTALAARFPRMQEIYFSAARAMNYDPAFPGTILPELLENPNTALQIE